MIAKNYIAMTEPNSVLLNGRPLAIVFDKTGVLTEHADHTDFTEALQPSAKEAIQRLNGVGAKILIATGASPEYAKDAACRIGVLTAEITLQLDPAAQSIVAVGCPTSADQRAKLEQRGLPPAALAKMVDAVQYPVLPEESSVSEWDALLKINEVVLARVSPPQKVTIVQNLQRLGYFVVAVGDGLNDEPMLKQSNYGIASGISGDPTTKQAADCIVTSVDVCDIVAPILEITRGNSNCSCCMM